MMLACLGRCISFFFLRFFYIDHFLKSLFNLLQRCFCIGRQSPTHRITGEVDRKVYFYMKDDGLGHETCVHPSSSWSLPSIKYRRPIILAVKCDKLHRTGNHHFGSQLLPVV